VVPSHIVGDKDKDRLKKFEVADTKIQTPQRRHDWSIPSFA